jgi:Leucine-rich repeat (LRR) protein
MKYIKTYEQSIGITFQEWLKNHPQDLNTTIIDCSYSNLIDLDGIEQFTNLKGLFCYNNQLTSLPDLPDILKYLNCDNNQLTSLPDLPDTLKILICSDNKLPYNDLKGYWKWFEKTYPEKVAAKKYNL